LSDLIDIFLCHFRARLPEFPAGSNRGTNSGRSKAGIPLSYS
jgi:hypothetical protein